MASAVQSLPGGVVHQYGSRVVIVGVAPTDAESLATVAPAAAAPTDAATVSAGVKAQLDEIGALGLEALSLRVSPEYASAKANRPLEGQPWDNGTAMAPTTSRRDRRKHTQRHEPWPAHRPAPG